MKKSSPLTNPKEESQEVWVTSDPHINHKNLIRGISNWNDKSGCRPFDSRDEHNWTIINNINKYVKEDHTLYVLGDWSFGGISSIWWFRKQLKCKDIRFIFGNHDHHIEANKNLIIPENDHGYDLSEISIESAYTQTNKWKFKDHYRLRYSQEKEEMVLPAQDLFTWCKYYAEVKHWGHTYVLSHYAMRTWNKRHHNRFHLYGHSHNTLPERGDRSMDVGLESAYEILGEWRPFNIKEIQSRLQSRTNAPIDHHTEDTNE